jgi:hypothetical protein
MKTIHASTKARNLARFGIFLAMVTLMAGVVSCVYPPPFIDRYDLTISSTDGGAVTAPGEGTITYSDQDVVELVAEADEGYEFVEWSGDVGTIADVNAANTTIAMSDDYAITANFIAQYVLIISSAGNFMAQCELTISSTAGGCVVEPGEGTFTYDEGTVVDLTIAVEESPSRFVNWTGDVDTIADVSAGTTTITMDDDYSITANFKEVTNWLRIGAVMVVAVLVVGLASLFFIRRRKKTA